ncbi:OTU domain-containing protein 2 [Colletotrichum orbiculare MAFF 240422]|uniref:OTU domain-containing protein 2 n=1 Tax=Colletotrichum orbiculare (strain 104-T / ATCC 96160 / CBS 514.97 / LARS 414 / MAFF 240422) TaxID=1213857 RepID=N4VEG3_COLOR|nr:OTU domain-containing protein 2 [Colletotrichum orbiculare MAFF 240422]
MEGETLEQMQARHRKEQRELVGRITSKKKNATKKTRKGVNDECAEMERRLREKQDEELAALAGGGGGTAAGGEAAEGEAADEDAADAVATKLAETNVSEPAPTTPDAVSRQEENQGQGKKRNRQKERLARRAAEVEAAAVKAESEAAGMTDHRGKEREAMRATFEEHALAEKEIAPDGHCLFAAVADQLALQGVPLGDAPGPEASVQPYKVVRRRAAEWMEAHPDDFAPFLEEGLEGYVKKIRDTAEWGGQLELAALANAYGVEIRVVQDGRTERIEPAAQQAEGKEVWLAYYRHGYGLGEHYNSLRKTA